jgi:hypothetical protein
MEDLKNWNMESVSKRGKYIMKIEQKKKQYGLKTNIIIADDLMSDGVSKETTQAVIDFIKNKNKSKH